MRKFNPRSTRVRRDNPAGFPAIPDDQPDALLAYGTTHPPQWPTAITGPGIDPPRYTYACPARCGFDITITRLFGQHHACTCGARYVLRQP